MRSNLCFRIFVGMFISATCCLILGTAEASVSITHNGSTSPASEGFSVWECCGPSTTSPISNDLGLAAYSISSSTLGSQYGFISGALSSAQKADIFSHGFILTMTVRVIQGAAPNYDTTNYTTIGAAGLSTEQGRFSINLGLDSNGDTVAVLPTYLDNSGYGGAIRSFGPSYTMTGAGNSYHTYSLVYDPRAQQADLLIDGITRIKGYGGYSQYRDDAGLDWWASSGGQGNFNFVQLVTAPVPELETYTMMLAGMGLIGAMARRRKSRG